MNWLISGMAELYVAYREDRQLYRISKQAWCVAALFATLFITAIVLLTEAM